MAIDMLVEIDCEPEKELGPMRLAHLRRWLDIHGWEVVIKETQRWKRTGYMCSLRSASSARAEHVEPSPGVPGDVVQALKFYREELIGIARGQCPYCGSELIAINKNEWRTDVCSHYAIHFASGYNKNDENRYIELLAHADDRFILYRY